MRQRELRGPKPSQRNRKEHESRRGATQQERNQRASEEPENQREMPDSQRGAIEPESNQRVREEPVGTRHWQTVEHAKRQATWNAQLQKKQHIPEREDTNTLATPRQNKSTVACELFSKASRDAAPAKEMEQTHVAGHGTLCNTELT